MAGLLVLTGGWAQAAKSKKLCTATSVAAFKACYASTLDDFWIAVGKCDNLSDVSERKDCLREAKPERKDNAVSCREQFAARRDVCDALGEDPYDPQIDPADFVVGIDNPFLPLVPGTTMVYQKGEERIEVKVTAETKEILGVTCVEVEDTVTIDGELVEETLDWYAQDMLGNVWYFGELSRNYEDGELNNLDGSWQAGVDGAKPGIVMLADPMVGDVYRQEFLLGEAEDMARVVARDEEVTVPHPPGTFTTLKTEEWNPLEPEMLENKFYAPGVGLVLAVDVVTGEREELIDIIME
ncbi:hypothetical protein [Trichloromonas sp.]|uniref:hypothetical protein n=1 Tax=Trichloromonas sp. TaxID=3069249 RepID=UPI003D813001